jgi:peptide/nickel transport system substrate-binding protein
MRRFMSFTRALGLLTVTALAAALILAAHPCLAQATASPAPTGTDTFRVGWLESPDTLSPFLSLVTSTYILYHLNYDFLVGFDAATLKPRPELATSWSVSPNGKVWTFKTREGVRWQDGIPFTARDVAFTFQYIVKNGLPGVGAYTTGIVSARAVDDTTVVIRTQAPKASMLDMIVPILPEHIWSKVSPKAAGTAFQNPPPVVGTGPFQIVEFQPGKFVRLKANAEYWGGAPKVDQLIFAVYQNPMSMVSDLQTGAVDGAIGVPQAQFAGLNDQGIAKNRGVSWTWSELGFNCSDSPASKGAPALRDPGFRQALQYAIDREKVAEVAFGGYATPGSSLVVPYVPFEYHWEPAAAEAFTYDPARAGELLDAASYKDVNGDGRRETKQGKPLSLRLMASTSSPADQTAARLIAGWFRAVGVKTVFTTVDAGAMLAAVYDFEGANPAPDYDMAIGYWTNDVDPDTILQIFTAANIGIWNDVYWSNPEYEALTLKQSQTLDPDARRPIVQAAQKVAYEQAPFTVLAYPELLEAYRADRWTGFVPTPSDISGVTGAVLFSWNNIDTYRFVAPKATAATTAATAPPYYLIAVVAAGVVIVIALLVWRRRRRAVEE